MSFSALVDRFKRFNTIWDSRFEDVTRTTWLRTTYRDFCAGLIVALTAIPMAMGFAMAMGLQPEQGIIASAVAGIIGGIFGGSKYQVYGPTAAFIPVIGALITKYGVASGGDRAAAHGFLVLCSVCAGVILLVLALLGMGRYAQKVPKSIVMGFTIGISITIAFSSIGEALGLTHEIHGDFVHKLALIWEHLAEFNGYACCLALLTFGMARYLLRLSIFIPAPLLALGLCTMLAETVFAGKGISLVADRYGHISTSRLVFTPPCLPPVTGAMILDLSYFVLAIVFVSGVESLLCSSLADQMANNRRTQYSPDKEFWGQGLMQILTPLINGFPCTGALARTAISINVGAVSPLGGAFKSGLVIFFAIFLAPYIEKVPMACIGGILLWVACNMVRPAEIRLVWNHNRFHAFLMVCTAVLVPLTDFLTGVCSALVMYAVLRKFLDKPPANRNLIQSLL
ncbi:hypothetical protein LBMAG49_30630 [Planctomycetota bacterium]|nr:hypothetical protein LBMAG49_30630 [Planctomycetota bacterium]